MLGKKKTAFAVFVCMCMQTLMVIQNVYCITRMEISN